MFFVLVVSLMHSSLIQFVFPVIAQVSCMQCKYIWPPPAHSFKILTAFYWYKIKTVILSELEEYAWFDPCSLHFLHYLQYCPSSLSTLQSSWHFSLFLKWFTPVLPKNILPCLFLFLGWTFPSFPHLPNCHKFFRFQAIHNLMEKALFKFLDFASCPVVYALMSISTSIFLKHPWLAF